MPLLAKSWEVAPDGLSITFHLRDDVKFHCGEPFNAEAVKFSIERAKDWPPSKHKDSVKNILDVEVVDEYTVRVHLKKEDRFLVDWFATTSSVIVCPHCVKEYGEDYGVSKFCGTGPFRVKEWIRDDRIVLERNPDYKWGPARYQNRGPAHLDGIIFRVIPESLVQEAELEAGRVHMLEQAAPRAELFERWERNPDIVMLKKPYSSMVYIGFNVSSPTLFPVPANYPVRSWPETKRPSPCNDVRVRQALNYATYQENLVEYAYEGMGLPAHGPLVSSIWGYWPGVENYYQYNPDKARQLLAEAGYADGLNLELLTTSAPPYPRLAEILREQWKLVGVDLSIQVLEFGLLIDCITKAQFDMFIMGYTWHNADMIWWLWHRVRLPPGPNRFWWGSDYSDAVIENTFLLDSDTALAALYESQRLIMDDAVITPTVERAMFMAHRAELKGYRAHPLLGWCWKFLDTYIEEHEE
ncbi:MAG: ABC transporter substrate-binding protein [Candidatus Hodarchaeaceae archaeon]|nr:ABC transporter substrate-binding protein [Candidatus Hodarchaeaceae archaeon]